MENHSINIFANKKGYEHIPLETVPSVPFPTPYYRNANPKGLL
jgi:hypothetical protein